MARLRPSLWLCMVHGPSGFEARALVDTGTATFFSSWNVRMLVGSPYPREGTLLNKFLLASNTYVFRPSSVTTPKGGLLEFLGCVVLDPNLEGVTAFLTTNSCYWLSRHRVRISTKLTLAWCKHVKVGWCCLPALQKHSIPPIPPY